MMKTRRKTSIHFLTISGLSQYRARSRFRQKTATRDNGRRHRLRNETSSECWGQQNETRVHQATKSRNHEAKFIGAKPKQRHLSERIVEGILRSYRIQVLLYEKIILWHNRSVCVAMSKIFGYSYKTEHASRHGKKAFLTQYVMHS